MNLVAIHRYELREDFGSDELLGLHIDRIDSFDPNAPGNPVQPPPRPSPSTAGR